MRSIRAGAAQPRRDARFHARLHAVLELANLAEDRQGVAAEKGADMAAAIARLTEEGIDRAAIFDLLAHGLIAPVLTAHPTEVRRKSMIDHRNRVAELMALKGPRSFGDPGGRRRRRSDSRGRSPCCGRRACCAAERLYVTDEVETALSYLRDVFLPTLPALYQRWDRDAWRARADLPQARSWIGGDRDGNPFVTADSLKTALARSSEAVLAHYLAAIHALGAELSISSEHAEIDAAVAELADASGDDAPEPRRRALPPRVVGRLCAAGGGLIPRSPASPRRARSRIRAIPTRRRARCAAISRGSRTASRRAAAGRSARAARSAG